MTNKLKTNKNKARHPNFPNYWVYKTGRITDNNRQTIEQKWPTSGGNRKVVFLINTEGILQEKLVHQIVAETFLERPTNFNSTIDHLDNNRLNNNLKNLMYVAKGFNSIDGTIQQMFELLDEETFKQHIEWLFYKIQLKFHLLDKHNQIGRKVQVKKGENKNEK